MAESDLHLLVKMDCERVARYAPDMGGPESWSLSEKAIKGWATLLSKRGLVGSFGIHPEAAAHHKELFLELADEGFELHLQFHAGNFRGLEYRCYLGSYTRREQTEILTKAREDWMRALERPPRTFTPGGGSLNDDTWPVVYELGFRQAGMPLERNNPRVYSVTVGACPFPHHANPQDRLLPGSLELYVVPVTINWRRKIPSGAKHIDLRPEGIASLEVHKETIDQNIEIMSRLNPPVKVLVVPTHNTRDYSNSANSVRKTLESTLDYVKASAKEKGLRITPATFESIHLTAHKCGCSLEEEWELYRRWQRTFVNR